MKKLLFYFSISSTLYLSASESLPNKVSFNEHIRPIFSSTCFNCHGPDEHEAKAHLQLHTFEAATQARHYTTKSGRKKTAEAAIVPGDPEASPVWHRIDTDDEDDIMPPLDFHHELSDRDKKLVEKWILQGAEYQAHWAYEPIALSKTINIPKTIDEHVQRKLKEKHLGSQNNIDKKEVLIRRLSLDLRGLLPTQKEVDTFLKDHSPQAWEKLVDQFLNDKSYGEKMGTHWLDVVRYSNSVGFHGDQELRSAPYRDYVIDAFNNNMPYDQFTKEQLAGDLLENPTESQLIATAYNRLNKMTKEGGAQAGEYLAKYATDRVSNLSAVWLGSTLECAECHNHKYDPFTAEDFYSMAAFFADIKQNGVYKGGNNNMFDPEKVFMPAKEEKAYEAAKKALAASKNNDAKHLKELDKKIKAIQADDQDAKAEKKKLEQERNLFKKQKGSPETQKLQRQVSTMFKQAKVCVITETQTPRETRILPRGNWMDKSGKVVQPAVPHFMKQIQKEGRATRLDLASWLCSEDNPMASRAFMNRIWAIYFGKGLSGVVEDLGSQGELPSHPELLDALARAFIDSSWNIKAMVKGIVMSKTYQLSTKRSEQVQEKDPYNRYLSRQSILRLQAEAIRDTALQVSGLLNDKMGGRNIMPYQPDGYYASMNFNPFRYRSEMDSEQYRRAIYMHWQRTFLHPFLKNFDAPEREVAICSRTASNTPLQALTLLNDPSFVEAARSFAEKAHQKGGSSIESRIQWMLQAAFGRPAKNKELETLFQLYQSQYDSFDQKPEAIKSFLSIGNKASSQELQPRELAAFTQVARAILNSHEFIVRR